jgi:hypothetical protein
MRRILLVVLLGWLLVGCAPSEAPSDSSPNVHYVTNYNLGGFNVTRFVDAEAGVVCWVFSPGQGGGGGISCLPIDQTKLEVP